MIHRIFVDLDGVLADWMGAMLLSLNESPNKIIKNYDMRELGGFSAIKAKFTPTVEWWRDIPKLPWADKLLSLCTSKADTYFLSNAGWDPTAAHGKRLWVEKHYPHLAKRLILTAAKEACAFEGSMLLDDCEDNIQKFNNNRGFGILIPASWNHNFGSMPVKLVKNIMTHVHFERDLP